MRRILTSLFFALSFTALLPAFQEEVNFDKARQFLAADELDKAWDSASRTLAVRPYDREGYALMRKIAHADGDLEAELRWAKWQYWSLYYDGPAKEAKALAEELDLLHPTWNAEAEILQDWEDNVYKAANSAKSSKQYRLAGHFLDKLLGLHPSDKKLNKEYSKLIKKAGNEVSGGAFAAAAIRRKSKRWLDKQNAKHSAWDNSFERKTKHYKIYTNISWQFAETVAAAMDEINEFYRWVYDYKKSARATVYCMKNRGDYDKASAKWHGKTVDARGYWTAGSRSCFTYDHDGNQNSIWQTLFHEASHQFMTLLTNDNHITPTWLNEGTSSYFEGCVIKADGTILKNAPAEHRLREWWAIEHSPTKHNLHEMIAHIRNVGADETGMLSFEGHYYSYAWSLVYFLLNYEEHDRRVGVALTGLDDLTDEFNETWKPGRLVYRDAYLKYLKHFSKRGCKGDKEYAFEIAKKYFVDEIEDPDIPNWDAFEKRWRAYTTTLHGEMEAGPAMAYFMQARARGYLAVGDFERARVVAEQADAKRANNATTYGLLAEAYLGEGQDGEAAYWMTRRWELLWEANRTEDLAEAEAWLKENGGSKILKEYCIPTQKAMVAIDKVMNAAVDDHHPILASLFASHALRAFDSEQITLLEASQTYAEAADQDLRMWRRVFQDSPENNVRNHNDTIELISYQPNGVILNNPTGGESADLICRDHGVANLILPYSIRGTVEWEGDYGAGMQFGFGLRGNPQVGFNLLGREQNDDKIVEFYSVTLESDFNSGRTTYKPSFHGGMAYEAGKNGLYKMDFLLDVDKLGKGFIKIDGHEPISFPDQFLPEKLSGSFAIRASDESVALFSNVEVLPNTPFWPVE